MANCGLDRICTSLCRGNPASGCLGHPAERDEYWRKVTVMRVSGYRFWAAEDACLGGGEGFLVKRLSHS